MEIGAIVEFSEFEDDFNGFWLVLSGQTAMFFAVENSFTAFVDQMRADGVLSLVE